MFDQGRDLEHSASCIILNIMLDKISVTYSFNFRRSSEYFWAMAQSFQQFQLELFWNDQM